MKTLHQMTKEELIAKCLKLQSENDKLQDELDRLSDSYIEMEIHLIDQYSKGGDCS